MISLGTPVVPGWRVTVGPRRGQIGEAWIFWIVVLGLLLAGGSLARWVDSEAPSLLVNMAVVAALLHFWSVRGGASRLDRAHLTERGARHRRLTLAGALLGLLAGYASYPACVGTTYVIGEALGLRAADFPTPWASGALWLAAILLAPVWEELLYREWMLVAFRRAWGVVPAVVLSSAAFALPHAFGGGPWALLGTFLVGLGLAGVALVSRWIWLCVAIHAGLNLGALAWSFGPAWASLPPWASALAGWIGLGAALVLLRRERARTEGLAAAVLQAGLDRRPEADRVEGTVSARCGAAPAPASATTSHPEPT